MRWELKRGAQVFGLSNWENGVTINHGVRGGELRVGLGSSVQMC